MTPENVRNDRNLNYTHFIFLPQNIHYAIFVTKKIDTELKSRKWKNNGIEKPFPDYREWIV